MNPNPGTQSDSNENKQKLAYFLTSFSKNTNFTEI